MANIDKLIDRINQFLDRIEPLLPEQPQEVTEFNGGAYRWRCHGQTGVIHSIQYPPDICSDDLQCIDRQKNSIDSNTRQFLNNLPSNNVLLWGPKGTGKSSLIKALVNEYQSQGLNIVEVNREDLGMLRDISESLREQSGKFILYCDDLSFEENDPSYKAIKVVLDGSLSSIPDNVLIYATSNRRHLLPESMRDNQESQMICEELHHNEAIEEKISLSERFGVWLAFHPFNQDQYLMIVDYWIENLSGKIIKDKSIHKTALKWALEHGSRSGRSAYQFARDWYGKQQLEK